jgi:hypothetical protein
VDNGGGDPQSKQAAAIMTKRKLMQLNQHSQR